VRYVLTGNFQYDLGIYGLKKIFDFFDEEYKTDGKFYVETDRKPEEILELIVLKLTSDKGANYFLSKLADTILKDKKEVKKEYEKLIKENPVYVELDLEKLVKKEKSLDKVIDFLAEEIFKALEKVFKQVSIQINKGEIKEILWNKAVNLLNNILLNFQANMSAKGKSVLEKAVQKLYKDIDENTICSFCEQNPAKRITRDTFFFAPAQFNAFWFNEPSIFICPYCLVSNLAITQSFAFLGNEVDAVVIYRPNLEDMRNLNEGLKITDIGELAKKVIDYEKLLLKQEATTKDLQIIEFHLDPQNPHLEFYMLTDEIIDNLLKISNELEKLYTTYKDSLWGQVKEKKGYKTVNISKELLRYLAQNQKLIYLVQQFSKLALMAESFRQNDVKKPPVKGFYISVLLQILKMHFKLEEGLNMNHFEAFKEYGQLLRGRVYSQLSENGAINWNTFNNKIISLANSFLDASKGSFEHFMETLTRVMISYNASIDTDLLSMLGKDTYREISTVIAISLMTKKPGEEKPSEQKEEIVEEKSL
jgi:CRISPR-associated protein Cst1